MADVFWQRDLPGIAGILQTMDEGYLTQGLTMAPAEG